MSCLRDPQNCHGVAKAYAVCIVHDLQVMPHWFPVQDVLHNWLSVHAIQSWLVVSILGDAQVPFCC
jgi:hypothetical protein